MPHSLSCCRRNLSCDQDHPHGSCIDISSIEWGTSGTCTACHRISNSMKFRDVLTIATSSSNMMSINTVINAL